MSPNVEQWVVIVGRLVNGVAKIVGPFATQREARVFAQGDGGDDRYDEWDEVKLTSPGDEREDEDDDG